MKKDALLFLFIIIGNYGISQQKNLTQGYLELKLKYSARSHSDLPPPPPPPPPGMELPPQENAAESPDFGNDGFVIKIWFNPNFEKVVNTQYGRTTFLFNAVTKSTIELQEHAGDKIGYITTAEDETAVKNYMDSLTGIKEQAVNSSIVEYIDDQKTIAGFQCKKALIITMIPGKKNDTTIVWYAPDYKVADNFCFSSDKLEHRSKLASLKLINGLPIQASIRVTPKITLEIEIKKMDTKKIVSDKEFTIANDFKLRSIKEFYGLK